jgi:hypothetical protein
VNDFQVGVGVVFVVEEHDLNHSEDMVRNSVFSIREILENVFVPLRLLAEKSCEFLKENKS